MEFLLYLYLNGIIIFSLCYKLINGQQCEANDIVLDYKTISSLSQDPIKENYAKIVINNCLFGKEHIFPYQHNCFYHCSLRENSTIPCVAIYLEGNECRMCFDGTPTTNFDEYDHENLLIRQQDLGEPCQHFKTYTCNIRYIHIGQTSICVITIDDNF